VAKDLKVLDRHELNCLSFAVRGPPFELAGAVCLGVLPVSQALIKFMSFVLCLIFPINP
jgi:hypothetical protein